MSLCQLTEQTILQKSNKYVNIFAKFIDLMEPKAENI